MKSVVSHAVPAKLATLCQGLLCVRPGDGPAGLKTVNLRPAIQGLPSAASIQAQLRPRHNTLTHF